MMWAHKFPLKAVARLSKYAGKDPNFSSIEEAKRYFKIIYADFGNMTEAQWQHFTENSIREVAPGKFITKVDQGIKLLTSKKQISLEITT